MPNSDPLRVDAPLTYTPCAASPELRFGEVTLEANLVPGISPSGPTLVLCGACNVASSLADHYGGRILAAIRIVMMHADSGAVFTATVAHHESPPLVLAAAAPATPSTGPTRFSGHYFNVDLGAHLFLPPEAGLYHVLLWLDDLAAPLALGSVPANAARATPRGPSRDELHGVSPDVAAARPPAEGPVLALAGDRIELTLPGSPLDPAAPAPRLGLFVTAGRSRAFRYLVDDPRPRLLAGGSNTLAVDLDSLGIPRGPGEMLHVVAIVGAARSNVLDLPFA